MFVNTNLNFKYLSRASTNIFSFKKKEHKFNISGQFAPGDNSNIDSSYNVTPSIITQVIIIFITKTDFSLVFFLLSLACGIIFN